MVYDPNFLLRLSRGIGPTSYMQLCHATAMGRLCSLLGGCRLRPRCGVMARKLWETHVHCHAWETEYLKGFGCMSDNRLQFMLTGNLYRHDHGRSIVAWCVHEALNLQATQRKMSQHSACNSGRLRLFLCSGRPCCGTDTFRLGR